MATAQDADEQPPFEDGGHGSEDGGHGSEDAGRQPHRPNANGKGTDDNSSKHSTKKQQGGSSNQDSPNGFHLTHSPVRFYKVVRALSEDRKDVVKEMGFGGLLHMPNMQIRKIMIVAVAKQYQVGNKTFKICDHDIPMYPEDVKDIMGLEIEGANVQEFIDKTVKSEEKTKETELFKRYAAANGKLELKRLEDMILDSDTPDEDFKRAFVLFTIGVILAPTTVNYIDYSYIQVVEHLNCIQKFNWGQFTLNFLLESCHTYKKDREATLKGNLLLLQCWYWDRVIIQDCSFKYDKEIQPRMAMWNEKNATSRTKAFTNNKGINEGTLMLSRHTPHQKNEPPEPSMSQARPSKYAHEGYKINPSVHLREEGLSKHQMQSLQGWKKEIEGYFELQVKKETNDMEHRLRNEIISQSMEFASFKNEIRQALSRVSMIEAENAEMKMENLEMKMEIKGLRHLVQVLIQPTPTTARVQTPVTTSEKVEMPVPTSTNAQPSSRTTYSHWQESPHTRFKQTRAKINDEALAPNGTTKNTMQQQGGPSANITPDESIFESPYTHIKRRQPIIDNNYDFEQIDADAALFVSNSYGHARVVHIHTDITEHILTAEKLRLTVESDYIADEVINTYVHLSNVENDSASYISTHYANLIITKRLGSGERSQIKKTIAEKCEGRHLVFVPMHINDNHWALLVLNFIKTEVQILNSLPTIRDMNLEKELVEGIQSCIEYSVKRDLVKFVKPINLREWDIVPYVNIPIQKDSVSCGAYVIKYILAWDGDKMAEDFIPKEIKVFRYKICSRLLLSEQNLRQFPSDGKPITKEEYYAKYPEERANEDAGYEDEDAFEVALPEASMREGKGKTASGTEITKRPRGRPRKCEYEGNTSSGGTTKVGGAAARKRNRPTSKKVAISSPTVADELSTECLAKRIRGLRTKHPGKQQTSPYSKY